jgi:hypothetical protein
MDPTERQQKIDAEVERGLTQAEAVGRQAAREAGSEPLDGHGYDEPRTVGHDRPGPSRGD